MKKFFLHLSFWCVLCSTLAQQTPTGEKTKQQAGKVWVFILAGQSNMAGRGKVEAQDTVASPRVLTVNGQGDMVPAKEPLHFYEPKMKGVGCGLAFGKELLKHIPANVTVLLIPTAVGGSSINQWIEDREHRGVQLLSNFRQKVEWAKLRGEIKAILWHQGESDATPQGIASRREKLKTLFSKFREIAGNPDLPILMGELGSYSKTPELFNRMNEQIRFYAASDHFTAVVPTSDFGHIGDFLHINSAGQREMGKRFALEYVRKFCIQKPVVVLSFDDGSATHYTNVAPLLKKYGFTATFFVCEYPRKPEIAAVKNLTWKQIQALDSMGFEIGNHTGHHKGVGKLTQTQLRDEIKYIEDRCKDYGIAKPVSFAYPGNRSDSVARVVLREMGYKFARVGGSRYFDPQKDDPLQIPSYTMTDKLDEKTTKALQELQPGQILVFTIHEVPDPDHENYTTSPALLEKYLKFMYANHFEVVAVRDLCRY